MKKEVKNTKNVKKIKRLSSKETKQIVGGGHVKGGDTPFF